MKQINEENTNWTKYLWCLPSRDVAGPDKTQHYIYVYYWYYIRTEWYVQATAKTPSIQEVGHAAPNFTQLVGQLLASN